ncbi:hypothetical protein D3C81_2061220 [compost metagenome]
MAAPAGQLMFPFADNVHRIVGGAAIQDEYFDRNVLLKYGPQGIVKITSLVEGGYCNRNKRLRHSVAIQAAEKILVSQSYTFAQLRFSSPSQAFEAIDIE